MVLHPVSLIETFRKGLADEVGEKNMMAETFGVIGTYRDVINLFSRVVESPPVPFLNYDGSSMPEKDLEDLIKSGRVLKEKYESNL